MAARLSSACSAHTSSSAGPKRGSGSRAAPATSRRRRTSAAASGAVSPAPRLSPVEAGLFERAVPLRLPFRFGAWTMTEASQAFVRVRVRLEDGREAEGAAAEVLAPKWFDKDPALSAADTVGQLRGALASAVRLYAAAGPATAFGLWRETYDAQLAGCAAAGIGPLAAGFGPALLDKAVLDALCRAAGVSVFAALAANLPGVEGGAPAPDLDGFDVAAFVRALRPAAAIAARHTVGLLDPLSGPGRLDDGLPETLEQVIAAYGQRYFKVKLSGDPAADLARAEEIAAVLDRSIAEPYRVTLDGNEQFADGAALEAFMRGLAEAPALSRFAASVLFVEQPFPRETAPCADVSRLAVGRPLLVDEADGTMDSFPRARALGWRGVSSKSCKGLYKSLLNAARCRFWSESDPARPFFVSAEDLMTQPGLGLQQDLALAAAIGCAHVERNGHHYAGGMAGAPPGERRAFLAAHPDLYRAAGGTARVVIAGGRMALGSLSCPGFAAAATPDFSAMRPMPEGG